VFDVTVDTEIKD